MKRLIALALLIIPVLTYAQSYTQVHGRWEYQWLRQDSASAIPNLTGAGVPGNDTTGLHIRFNPSLGVLQTYLQGSGGWKTITAGGLLTSHLDTAYKVGDTLFIHTTAGNVLKYNFLTASDTLNLSNQIALKLNAADTTSLSNRINTKLAITDTTGKWLPQGTKYLVPSDTVPLNSEILNRVKYADTASMLTPYLRKGDTSSMLSPLWSSINSRVYISEVGALNGVASLDGSGHVPTSQLPAEVLGSVKYVGTWNASTNYPVLTSGVGTQGNYYVVDTAGSTSLDGTSSWNIGDWAIYDGTKWSKVDNTSYVSSVNGQKGSVSLSTTNIPEGTNQYFTTARAQAAISGSSPISLSSGVVSISQASGSSNGYLSSGDWNTFNTKEAAISPGTTGQYWRGDKTWQTLSTAVVPENGNEYFTNARAQAAFTAGTDIGLSAGTINNTSTLQSVTNRGAATTDTIHAAGYYGDGSHLTNVSSSTIAKALQAYDTQDSTLYFGYDTIGQTITFKTAGFDWGTTVPMNIGGTALMWHSEKFNGGYGQPLINILGEWQSGRTETATAAEVQTFLGLGSNAYNSTAYLPSANISGTNQYLPIFTSSNTLANSPVYYSSGIIGINAPVSVNGYYNLNVSGEGRFTGWYTSGGGGPAAEVGYAGFAALTGYDRDAGRYYPVGITGGSTNINYMRVFVDEGNVNFQHNGTTYASVDSAGNFSGASFYGAGTGLTGTASSLTAGYANILSTTNQGTPSYGALVAFSSTHDWYKPIGWSGFVSSASTGMPVNNDIYFQNVAHRDVAGGWGGIAINYSNGGFWYGTAQDTTTYATWVRVLDANNYNSYAPTLTGGGAGGTWGINITGTAAGATNSTEWGTLTSNYTSGVQSGGVGSILGVHTNGYAYAFNAAAIQTFLGLGSAAYQSTGSYIQNDSTAVQAASFHISGSGTAWEFFRSSDKRLKNIVKRGNYANPLDIPMAVFHWKRNPDGPVNYGVIAQTVQKYYPEIVQTNPDGYLSVDYDQLHTLQIYELKKEVDELKAELKAIKKEIREK